MVDRSPGFFDLADRLTELSTKRGDLERVKALVGFEMFRPALEAAVPRADCSRGGRPAFDHVLMFKLLILQTMHALSRCFVWLRTKCAAASGRGMARSPRRRRRPPKSTCAEIRERYTASGPRSRCRNVVTAGVHLEARLLSRITVSDDASQVDGD